MSLKRSRLASLTRSGYATIATLILFVSLSGQNPDGPLKLSTNEPIDSQIKGGETHIYEVTLNRGEYARAEVEQKNIDVVVSLFDANGKLVVEMDGKDGRLWHESVSMIAKSGKAAFQVKICAYGGSGQVGDYRIRLVEVRPTNANDRKRLKAEKHLSNGRTFYEQLKSQAAANEYEIATALFRELGDAQQEAITLTNLGQAFFRLSEYDRSIIANKRAMELFQKTKDRLGEAKTVNTLGSNYRVLDQPDKAWQFFEKALAIRREVKDRNGEGGTIYNLGLLYYNLLDYEKAAEHYTQALVIFQETRDRGSEGNALNNLGNVYYQLSDYEKATIHFEKALVISREVKDRSEEGKILFNLGISDYNLSNYEKANDYLEKALHISRELEDRSEEGKTLYALGSVCDQLSDHETAMAHYEQAMIIYRMLGDRMNEVKVYWDLSFASQLLNDPQVEIFYGKLAVNVYRETRGNLNESDNESRKKFLADNSVRYGRVADILISEERSKEAQAVLNLFKELESDQSERSSIKLADLVPYSKGEAETITSIDKLVELKRKKNDLEKIKKTKGPLPATDRKKLDGIVAAIASASRAFRKSIEKLKKSNF